MGLLRRERRIERFRIRRLADELRVRSASQAMAFGPGEQKLSQVAACLNAARFYELRAPQARDIIDRQLHVITDQWDDTADVATFTEVQRNQIWGWQVLNPFATYGYEPSRTGTRRAVRHGEQS